MQSPEMGSPRVTSMCNKQLNCLWVELASDVFDFYHFSSRIWICVFDLRSLVYHFISNTSRTSQLMWFQMMMKAWKGGHCQLLFLIPQKMKVFFFIPLFALVFWFLLHPCIPSYCNAVYSFRSSRTLQYRLLHQRLQGHGKHFVIISLAVKQTGIDTDQCLHYILSRELIFLYVGNIFLFG